MIAIRYHNKTCILHQQLKFRTKLQQHSFVLLQVLITTSYPLNSMLEQGDTMDIGVGYISVIGPAVVRAKHLKLPPGLKIVDPESYICAVSDYHTFNAKVHIS